MKECEKDEEGRKKRVEETGRDEVREKLACREGQGYGTRWGLASMHQGIQTRSAWKMRMWAGRSALLDGA